METPSPETVLGKVKKSHLPGIKSACSWSTLVQTYVISFLGNYEEVLYWSCYSGCNQLTFPRGNYNQFTLAQPELKVMIVNHLVNDHKSPSIISVKCQSLPAHPTPTPTRKEKKKESFQWLCIINKVTAGSYVRLIVSKEKLT